MKFHPTLQGIFDPVLDKVVNPDIVGGGSAVDFTIPMGLLSKLRSWYDFEDTYNDGWGANPLVDLTGGPGVFADASGYGSGVSGKCLLASQAKTRKNVPNYGTAKSFFMGSLRSQSSFTNDLFTAHFNKNGFNDSLSLMSSAAGFRSRGVLDSAGPGVYTADTIDSINTWTLTVAQHMASGEIRSHVNSTFNAATNAGNVNLNPTDFLAMGSPSGLLQAAATANLFWGEGELTQEELTYLYNGGAGKTISEIISDANYSLPTTRFTQNLSPTYLSPPISYSGTRVGLGAQDPVTNMTYTNTSKTSGKHVFALRFAQALADLGSTFIGLRTEPGTPSEGGAFLNFASNQTTTFQQAPFTLGSAPGLSVTAANDVYMFAVDFTNLKLFVGKNGTWSGDPVAGTNPAWTFSSGHELVVWCQTNDVQFAADFYFTTADYPYTAPAGFAPWGD